MPLKTRLMRVFLVGEPERTVGEEEAAVLIETEGSASSDSM